MKLLEHEAKELFRRHGVPVPPTGGVIRRASQLPAALRRAGRGPWVLKAQVLAGGRGKAGGIKIVRTPGQARAAARAMLGMELVTRQTQGQALVVRELLVDRASDIAREIYLSVVLDRRQGQPVLIASAEGGVEIEELARARPEAILREPVHPYAGLLDYQGRRLAFALGLGAGRTADFVRLARALVRVFLESDASLVEVNPLIVTKKGELVALDAKIVTDDNALFRHPEQAAMADRESSRLEAQARKVGISYVGLDGDIGCLVNGAGLAMATMDTVQLAGGSPANFLDVGGGANAEQVRRAFQILLKDPRVRAVLVNIFGGIMKCTTIAEGVLAALKTLKLRVPLVVRLEGTQVNEGRALLERSGLPILQADSLWDGARKAVAAAKKGAPAPATPGNGRKS